MVTDETLNPAYKTALDFLYSFVDYERSPRWKYTTDHFNLDRVRSFLSALGDPHEHGWYVHVGGTNGKGSVTAMIANALHYAGFSVGHYTSPHLITFRERIRVNGRMIPVSEVIEGIDRIKTAAEQVPGLTFFDVWTGCAFDYFTRKNVDASVVEVGMGGRLDTTNVIIPAVSVLTSISIDHRGILGDTASQIAYEKAGIIKPGIAVVSAPQDEEVVNVLEKKAQETRSPFVLVGRDVIFSENEGWITYRGLRWKLDRVTVPLLGSMQYENAAAALAAMEILESLGYPITSEIAVRGIETVYWPGRLHILSHQPEVIVDGACNPNAMRAICKFIAQRNTRENTVAIVAMCRDKEIDEVLRILGGVASTFILTRVKNPRAMDTRELAQHSPDNVRTIIEQSSSEALGKARSLAGTDGLVIVTGSLYLVGDILSKYLVEQDGQYIHRDVIQSSGGYEHG